MGNWFAINGRDFTPVYSTGTSSTDATKWYTVDGTISANSHQTAVAYASSVGIGAVYSKSAVCGYTFSNIKSDTYDIYAYMKSYNVTGAYLRLNGGAWNSGGAGVNASTYSWIKLGSFTLKTGDKIEVTEEGGVGGGSVVIKDFYFVSTGSTAPTYVPTGQEGYRVSATTKYLIQDKNSILFNCDTTTLTKLNGTLTDSVFINKGISNYTVLNNQSITQFGREGTVIGTLGAGKHFEVSLEDNFNSINRIE